jgi:hypothetical protein
MLYFPYRYWQSILLGPTGSVEDGHENIARRQASSAEWIAADFSQVDHLAYGQVQL